MSEPITVLFISSAVKGQRCIEECKRLGCRTYLLTEDRWRDADWPRASLDGMHTMHSLVNREHVIHAVTWMARGMQVDLIIPLDEYEIETAAVLRQHLQMPGTDVSAAHVFNDKLAMRNRARAAGIPVPDYSPVFNYDALRAFMRRVPGPWLLKPRNEAGAMGIRRVEDEEDLWRQLDILADKQSWSLLEKFVPSDVFHVDSVVYDGRIVFSAVSGYGRPPLAVSHGGGVFTSRTLGRDTDESRALTPLNERVIQTLGLRDGVTHIEFLRVIDPGQTAGAPWLFLEAAARVGGANLSDMIEYATGVNLWEQWARIEVARARGTVFEAPVARDDNAGILVCLARMEHPDMGAYHDPEICWRMEKPYHAGLIVVSPNSARVASLLHAYAARFADDFLTSVKPMETGRMV